MAQDTTPNPATFQTPSAVGAALSYLSGFGNSFETEALPGALPVGQIGRAHV